MLHTKLIFVLVLLIYIKINAVPPEACFANFRWEDCGRPPRRVLYYWKPGSRCEVGIWRGCLPNINMFHDEYECVATCIFTSRALPLDFHIIQKEEEEEVDIENKTEITEVFNVTTNATDVNETTTEITTLTDGNATITDGNATVTSDTGSKTDAGEANATTTVETNATITDNANTTGPADANTTATNSTTE